MKQVKPKVLTVLMAQVLERKAKTQKLVQKAIQPTAQVTAQGIVPKARMLRRVAKRATLIATRRVKLAVQLKRVKPKVLTVLMAPVLELTAKTQKVVQAAIQKPVQVTGPEMTPQARMVLRVAKRATLIATRRVKLAVQLKRVKPKVLTVLMAPVLELTAKTQKVVQAAIQKPVQVTGPEMTPQARMVLRVAKRATLIATRRVKLVEQLKRVTPKVLTVLMAPVLELTAKTQKVVQAAIQGIVQVTVPEARLLARMVQRAMLAATQRVKLAEQVEQLKWIKPKVQMLDRPVRVRQVAQRMALDAMTKPIFRLLTKATAKIKLKVTSIMLAEFRWAALLPCHQGCSRAPKGLHLRAA